MAWLSCAVTESMALREKMRGSSPDESCSRAINGSPSSLPAGARS